MRSSPRYRILHRFQSNQFWFTVGKQLQEFAVPRSLRSGYLYWGTLLEILFLGGLIWSVFGLIPIITATNGAAAQASMMRNDPISSLTSIFAGKSLLMNHGNSDLEVKSLAAFAFSSCSDKLYAGGLDGAVSTWSVREGIQMGHIKPN